jgi:hypothetical protein
MKFNKAEKLPFELNTNPGVQSYDISGAGKKVSGGRFNHSHLKSIFDPKNDYPGPNSYVTEQDVSKRQRGVRFVTGKKVSSMDLGHEVPGPNAYQTKPTYAYCPAHMRRLNSASLRSGTRRDSEFSKRTPGAAKYYSLPTGNRWDIPKNFNKDIHTFGPIKDRFANSFQGNMAEVEAIPGPGAYMQILQKPEQASEGGRRSKYVGKQNEIGKRFHTMGADKDRFKNSIYGRLDLIAAIPGVGSYDVHHAHLVKSRPSTIANSSRPHSKAMARVR